MQLQNYTTQDIVQNSFPYHANGSYRSQRDLQEWHDTEWPVLICLLGTFRILKAGRPLSVHGAKIETLICTLALRDGYRIEHDTLLAVLWPDCEPSIAGRSLNSLVHSLRKLFTDEIGAVMPVLYEDCHYRLNVEAGIRLDLQWFQNLAHLGERHDIAGNKSAAGDAYTHAISFYRGELCSAANSDADMHAGIERERLRSSYLTMLIWLADYYYALGDYRACLGSAQRSLVSDPCNENAHRLLMRCYMQQGERSFALRQYRLCESLLRSEFDALPESATTALFDNLRSDSGGA